MTEQTSGPFIAVGVDGSEDSVNALRWAARQARHTGAAVHAVTAWEAPTNIFITQDYPGEDYRRDAERLLGTAVAEAVGSDPTVFVKQVAVQGRAALVLVREAAGAELLVVGWRGRGGLPGAQAGSVAIHCLHHAPCPVVVVRG